MKTTNPLPLTVFSQNDYPIELENMFDYQQNQTFTRQVVGGEPVFDRGFLTFTGDANVTEDEVLFVSFISIDGDTGELSIIEATCEVLVPVTTTIPIVLISGLSAFPSSALVSYRKGAATTPKDVTFGLQPSGGTTTNFRIRANSQGKGSVYIGEILRQYLPEFLAPKDYGTDSISQNGTTVNIIFNGVPNNLSVYYGSKYLDVSLYVAGAGSKSENPLNQVIKLFQEQQVGYVLNGSLINARIKTVDYTIGQNTFIDSGFISAFNLYPSIPCRKPIYLSANYGLLPDGELIDVSVPVLAFVNRAGQYEYIRFSGSNVNKYNVQEARLKQSFDSTLTNADTGLIYEGIELTLAGDETEQPFAYTIDKLEYQRCNALLMESPKAWLLVNGDLQQCLEVRVKRESVRFLSSFDKNRDNYTATCEVIICQPLGNPQY
jgi:hypothetical protein